MTRRRAAERFHDLEPPSSWPPSGEALAEAIRALGHPRRRALLDDLTTTGPGSVGQLARRTGLAPGSVSHHARVLARAGFIEPAPELAEDTRESWWRVIPRSFSWGPSDFRDGTAGNELAVLASSANLDYLLAAIRRWQGRRAEDPWPGVVSDTVVSATQDELDDLGGAMAALLADWRDRCRARTDDRSPRRAVRAISLVFPEADRG